jgi:DNA-binding LytR/AlgR family response regulator
MIKALVIEDEDLAANRLFSLLQQIEPDIEIAGPIDSVEQAILYLQKSQPDLLFLDIQLADGKSFSIFDRVKVNVPIIFTTAYDEYAIKAFELNSIDYLLKPVSLEKLRVALDKFKKISAYYQHDNINGPLNSLLQSIKLQAEPTYKTRFLVNKGDTLLPVTVEETAYFYAEDKAVFMVTSDNKKYLINYSLEELEEKLNPKLFFKLTITLITG